MNVRRVIVPDYNKTMLDRDFACIFNHTNHLEEEVGNTIIVGHNNKGLFQNLNRLQKKDQVKIYVGKKQYQYEVIAKEEVIYNQYQYENTKEKHLLTLITCTKNKKKRLVVTLIEMTKNKE